MEEKKEPQNKFVDKRVKFSIGYLIGAIILMMVLQQYIIQPMLSRSVEIPYSEFKSLLNDGKISEVSISPDEIVGVRQDESSFYSIRVEDSNLLDDLEDQEVTIKGVLANEGSFLGNLLGWILPLVLMFAFWYWMMGRMKGGASSLGGMFSYGKSKARLIQGEQTGVTFHDVGGADEAVDSLQEITEFLKEPQRFQRLGGKMPKGVLLVGPPGTGKTLLARATAGEAGVPFYSLSGSEFVEMFVGVGASRVRDLFDQAKKSAPSIIFIDEIDAIGARRAGAGAVGVHEEREQTLNQLLAEMDGFESTRGVVVMAASNRPEVLDRALLRPGRFDRQVVVDLPDLHEREQILNIHMQTAPLGERATPKSVARITPGFSGADLENAVNEASLLAARRDKAIVEMIDFEDAIERVMAGPERRTRAMNPDEKKIVAYHEAGHAVVAGLLPKADPVHKVSIVPRGRALGYTMQLPTEDRYLLNESELETRLMVLLGGRVAEALVFGQVSTGAADDLARSTDLARRMVTEYGMSPQLGPVRLAADPQNAFLESVTGLDVRVSPQTAAKVDTETRDIVENALTKSWELLDSYRPALENIAQALIEEETVSGEQVKSILARTMPWDELD